jgi:hypothetical protein
MRFGMNLRVIGQNGSEPVWRTAPWLHEVIEENEMRMKMLVGAGRRVRETVETLESMTLGELLYFALFGEGVPTA